MTGRTIAATVAVLVMLSLAACTSNPVQPAADPRRSATPAPVVETPGDSTEPTPAPSGPTTFPVTRTCEQLVSLEELYAFNPNFAVDPDYAPAPGSDAELIASYRGAACGWVNLSSGSTIEIAVARLATEDIEKIQNALVLTTPSVPTYGGVDYFENKDGVGTANVFSGDFWIVARSAEFFEPGDAETLITAVKGNLG